MARSEPLAEVSLVVAGEEYSDVSEYAYTTDVLQLGDPCSVRIPNPAGRHRRPIRLGDPLELYIAHPQVNHGRKVRKLLGLVTSREVTCSPDGGTQLTLGGADLGWHLIQNTAPLWLQLRGIRFRTLLERVLDPSWGFRGIRTDNDLNRALKLGRAAAVQALSGSVSALVPPIQVEPGERIADLLILYAKRARQLVNVSADGYLQLFHPQADPEPLYSLHLHADVGHRAQNNVERATLSESIDGLYTEAICVGTVVLPPNLVDATNPNEGRFRGTYRVSDDARPFAFERRISFSDGDQLTQAQAIDRARWKIERGLFDAWSYTAQVMGHVQNGLFFEADTGVDLHDTWNAVEGAYYVSAVHYTGRADPPGQTTTLTCRKPHLLRA